MRRISDPEFLPALKSPFPPGTSPFRQKGNGFLGDFEYFAARVPGGTEAVLKAVHDDATRAFLSQRFAASEWYDAFPNVTMQLAAARLSGVSFEEHRRRVGAFHAEALNSVYRALLRVVSNENVAIWGPRVTALYWDFGKTETRVVGAKEVTAIRHGVPKGLVQWMIWATVGFADATLRLAGARSPVTTIGEIEGEETRASQELCRVRLRMTWS